jgi:small subunit ribosomal protein S16
VATRIRLARGGKKKRPYYRIVVADSRASRDGKFIERIGSYDPLLTENKVTLNVERATHWLNVGAQPSERVSKLLALQGVQHKLVVVPTKPRDKSLGKAADPAPAGKGKAAGGEAAASSEPAS